MRLINVNTLELKEFFGSSIPPYAILSHTWGDEEVTFQDWQNLDLASTKEGFAKIQGACTQAWFHGHQWLWVDTNCIDKTSSAELTEAINSMYAWYTKSEVCYAYLNDVPGPLSRRFRRWKLFAASHWFTRGWTLQELLAPKTVIFYTEDWGMLDSRTSLAEVIEEATGIDRVYLDGSEPVKGASIAKKMSWLSRRTTTREEDIAYCMLGLFDINMPLLYGEGAKAFTRLQEEIIKVSNDHSIFCWKWNDTVPADWTSLLAHSPEEFRNCGDIIPKDTGWNSTTGELSTYQMTNVGLSIRLPALFTMSPYEYIACLSATTSEDGHNSSAWIPVFGEDRKGILYVARNAIPTHPIVILDSLVEGAEEESFLVKRKQRNILWTYSEGPFTYQAKRTPNDIDVERFGVYLVFQSGDLRSRFSIPPFVLSETVFWFDYRESGSFQIQDAVIHTSFLVMESGTPAEETSANETLSIVVEASKRPGSWACRVLPRDSLQISRAEDMELDEMPWRPARSAHNYAHPERDSHSGLHIALGPYLEGVGNGQVRLLIINWRGHLLNLASP